jgi:hypothetical protein
VPEELALAVRHHHGLAQLQGVELPLLTRQLVALSTMANATLSGVAPDWLRDVALVATVLEVPVDQLQQRFDQCVTVAARG